MGDRIYGMFAILADVRNLPHWHITPLPYRGFPKDACPDTIRHYGRPVKETFESEDDDEYFYLRSKAEDWVSRGYSKFYKIRDQDYCSCPDWHSPNWCTTEELEECINKVFKDDSGNWKGEPDEWLALLGAMKGYETTGEFECRAVFWFDS